jgi:hypothetical protein
VTDLSTSRAAIQAIAAQPCRCGDRDACLVCEARRIDARLDVELLELVKATNNLFEQIRSTRRGRALLWLMVRWARLKGWSRRPWDGRPSRPGRRA